MSTELPVVTHYLRIGGAEKIHALVDRFYELMDELPEAYGIRKIHSESLQGANDKLFKFLSGWLGGPQLFIEEFGEPFLRRRHFPFSIGESERDQWMMCMNHALDDIVEDEALKVDISIALSKVADHMRNRGG